jgi:hypothetical protein
LLASSECWCNGFNKFMRNGNTRNHQNENNWYVCQTDTFFPSVPFISVDALFSVSLFTKRISKVREERIDCLFSKMDCWCDWHHPYFFRNFDDENLEETTNCKEWIHKEPSTKIH